ncbi:MAG TPA: hypothetical protein VIN10_00080 [Bacteroidales bacterium]
MKNLIISILVAFVAMAALPQANAQTFKSNVQNYSIPAYDVPVSQNTNFQEPIQVFKKNPKGDRARRTAQVDVETQNPPTSPNAVIAIVELYSLDGQDVYGPYSVYENEILNVEVDEREWGVTVIQVMENSEMSVWIVD